MITDAHKGNGEAYMLLVQLCRADNPSTGVLELRQFPAVIAGLSLEYIKYLEYAKPLALSLGGGDLISLESRAYSYNVVDQTVANQME